ncbi:putative disease resistance RPP13-like protein 1 [Arachis duranensis]|uniref:Disease resistance RPP13-like protein 1 n=1 Tax=Arachis duranensis TaxID=130453 RepID=A0A6P4CEB0_ARADU|nr:putative disease resistance RPP13-like protein 1 [Arachis duranensis]
MWTWSYGPATIKHTLNNIGLSTQNNVCHHNLTQNQTRLNRKIVKKCKGLPLTVKTLGGLLRSKYHEEDWKNVLESEIWELSEDDSKIVPTLRVSYHYLPSHLKRCFVCCSLFPEDYLFDKDELILLWMAEGLLQPIGKSTLEKIGCAYFNELVARSFFQPSNTNGSLFVMHDLIHDLATVFAGEFYFSAKNHGNAPEISIKTRHLSYIAKPWHPISKLPEVGNGATHMRSFLSICLFVDYPLTRIKCDSGHFLLHLRFLRVLSFKCFTLKSLSDSIGELFHLHYLDLSFTLVVTLPESLCKLYNLQTLKLRNCIKLKMLPSRMHDLVNLRHLDIEGASCLKEMPKGFSKLKNLNFLNHYIVGKHEENGIRELGTLDSLQGSLCIAKLENINNSSEALEAKMGNKKHINILTFKWLPGSDIVDFQTSRDIFNKLQPHGDLNELSIVGYRGETFPDWLSLGCFSYGNMTKLSLSRCTNCRQLPSLGQLSSLKHLEISELDVIRHLITQSLLCIMSYNSALPIIHSFACN